MFSCCTYACSNHSMDCYPSKLLYSPHIQNVHVTLHVDSGPRLYEWTYKCIPLTAKATYILKATTWQQNCSVTTLFTTSTQSPTLYMLNTIPSIFPAASKEFYSPTSVPKVMQHPLHVMGMLLCHSNTEYYLFYCSWCCYTSICHFCTTPNIHHYFGSLDF